MQHTGTGRTAVLRATALNTALTILIVAGAVLPAGPGARAAEVTVAVAANFLATLQQLEPEFEQRSGHELRLAAGSTGSLYAQIANGAPYDVFLAADEARPARALEEGHAVPGSGFVYAVGTLILWSADPDRPVGPEALDGEFHHLAIANPRTAPYGAAAQEVLTAMGYWEALQGRIARAQSVAGAWSAVASGAADLGFVALSSVVADGAPAGSHWEPPQALYTPLRQSAVLLTHGAGNPGAAAFLEFLRSDDARAAIRRAGYRIH
ncbi:molybdate ABC transporter substrate-binding protein [Lentisalinibacter sediminis]|uniref:molybdate ABC transporter substrate-binding protein n=1 Tax=Lentisalinibacter sediminis TaxID=2992237 RepID=UPI003868B1BC